MASLDENRLIEVMSDSAQIELNRRHHASVQQFGYFLMAAAGACIAAAISHTTGDRWSIVHAPWAAAVASWGLSIFFGICAIEKRVRFIQGNAAYLAAMEVVNASALPTGLNSIDIANAMKSKLEKLGGDGRPARTQKWLFFLGGLLYLGFHLWQMLATEAAATA